MPGARGDRLPGQADESSHLQIPCRRSDCLARAGLRRSSGRRVRDPGRGQRVLDERPRCAGRARALPPAGRPHFPQRRVYARRPVGHSARRPRVSHQQPRTAGLSQAWRIAGRQEHVQMRRVCPRRRLDRAMESKRQLDRGPGSRRRLQEAAGSQQGGRRTALAGLWSRRRLGAAVRQGRRGSRQRSRRLKPSARPGARERARSPQRRV